VRGHHTIARHAGDSGKWLRRLVVVRPGEDCLPGAVARRGSSPDQWGAVVDLHDEKLRIGELAPQRVDLPGAEVGHPVATAICDSTGPSAVKLQSCRPSLAHSARTT
jgi:hypothetical protein